MVLTPSTGKSLTNPQPIGDERNLWLYADGWDVCGEFFDCYPDRAYLCGYLSGEIATGTVHTLSANPSAGEIVFGSGWDFRR